MSNAPNLPPRYEDLPLVVHPTEPKSSAEQAHKAACPAGAKRTTVVTEDHDAAFGAHLD